MSDPISRLPLTINGLWIIPQTLRLWAVHSTGCEIVAKGRAWYRFSIRDDGQNSSVAYDTLQEIEEDFPKQAIPDHIADTTLTWLATPDTHKLPIKGLEDIIQHTAYKDGSPKYPSRIITEWHSICGTRHLYVTGLAASVGDRVTTFFDGPQHWEIVEMDGDCALCEEAPNE